MDSSETGKDMVESSPLEEIQRYCQGKFLSMSISREMSFSPKRWCCATGAKLVTCLARIVLLSHPLKKIPGCLSLSGVLLLHGIQALDSLIILQRLFLALNLCNNLLLRRRMWLEGIALEKFLIRIRILNQPQGHALILIHIMNLTLGLSILRKNSLPNLRRKLHQRFLKIRPSWEDFSTGARSKCTSEMYLHNNKETYHR